MVSILHKGKMIKVILNIGITVALVGAMIVIIAQTVYAGDGDDVSEKAIPDTSGSGNSAITIDARGPARVNSTVEGKVKLTIKADSEARVNVHTDNKVQLDVTASPDSHVSINGEGYRESANPYDGGVKSVTSLVLEEQPLVNNIISDPQDTTTKIIAASAIAGLIVFLVTGYYAKKHRARKST